MILPASQFLERAEELKRKGIGWPFEPGMMVARGYADFGYEAFVLLTNRKLVSLFTGQSSELLSAHEQFFFTVPTQSMLLDRLARLNINIVAVDYVLQKEWQLKIEANVDLITETFRGRALDEVLIEALLAHGVAE